MQEVSEGARGEVGGRGEAKGEKVSRVCAHGAAREGRAPQRAAVKAYTGGGGRWWSGCAGRGPRAWDWGRGSGAERRSAPARWASSGRGKWEARKVAQARVGRSGALEAGSVSGRASQLCLRALGNMAPRTALPDEGAEGVVRPWCRGERRGEERGGDCWRLRLAGRG